MNSSKVKAGQIWRDGSTVAGELRLLIVRIVDDSYAYCEVVHTGKRTCIRLNRFWPGPRGYYPLNDEEQVREAMKQLEDRRADSNMADS